MTTVRIPLAAIAVCSLHFLFGLTGVALGQAGEASEQNFTTYKLSLKAVGPPLPSLRYELIPSPLNQVSNNAALLHHRALHILADTRPSAKEFYQEQDKLQKALDEAGTNFPREEARAFLRPYGSVFREEEAAVKCDQCEWGTEQRVAEEGIGFLIPDAQKMRDLAFLLKLRCRLHIADRKIDLALRDIQTGLVLARHAAQGPTLIHFLIGNAIAAIFLGELEHVLQAPDCPNLYWSLTALPRPLIDLRKGMAGEMRSMEATIPFPKDIDKEPMTPENALTDLDRLWAGIQKLSEEPARLSVAQSRLALATYVALQNPSARKSLLAAGKTETELDAMPPAQVVMLDSLVRFRNLRDEYFVWSSAPYLEAIAGLKRSAAKISAARKSPHFDYLQTMLQLLLPALDKVCAAKVRTERRVASLRVVEAVRLYAAKNEGRLPARLADVSLVPIPRDPATYQPFGYEVAGNKFKIIVPPPPGAPPDRANNWAYSVTIVK